MVLTIGLTTITSCEAEDGNWSPVKLTVNGSRYRKTVYKVPARESLVIHAGILSHSSAPANLFMPRIMWRN